MLNIATKYYTPKRDQLTTVNLRHTAPQESLIFKPFWAFYSELSTPCFCTKLLEHLKALKEPSERDPSQNRNRSVPILITTAITKNYRQHNHTSVHIYFTDSRYSTRTIHSISLKEEKIQIIRGDTLGVTTILLTINKKYINNED